MPEEKSELELLWGERLKKLQDAYRETLNDILPGFVIETERKKGGKSYVCLYYSGEGWTEVPDYGGNKADAGKGRVCVVRHLLKRTTEIDSEVTELLSVNVGRIILNSGFSC